MNTEDKIQIKPAGPIDGEVTVPGSRSMTNRMLLLAALADGEVRLLDPLESEDTLRMKEGLRSLGFRVEDVEGAIIIEGRGGEIPASEAELNGGDSGTATRFLTALSTLGKGQYRIDGSERMRQRPIGDLLGNRKQGTVTYLAVGTYSLPVEAPDYTDESYASIIAQSN